MGTDTEKFIRDLGFVAPELWATRVRMFAQEMESRLAASEAERERLRGALRTIAEQDFEATREYRGAAIYARDTARAALSPAPEPDAQEDHDSYAVEWRDGAPGKPWSQEWFIAETTYGDRVVLKALPEGQTYDFKTADETYIARDLIRRWMQFPDSEFVAPQPPAASEPAGALGETRDPAQKRSPSGTCDLTKIGVDGLVKWLSLAREKAATLESRLAASEAERERLRRALEKARDLVDDRNPDCDPTEAWSVLHAALSRAEQAEKERDEARGALDSTWRCFQCGEVFTSEDAARDHFTDERSEPAACVDPLRSDEKLRLKELRDARALARRWRHEVEEAENDRRLLAEERSEIGRLFGMVGGVRASTAHQAWLVYEAKCGEVEAAQARVRELEAQLAARPAPTDVLDATTWALRRLRMAESALGEGIREVERATRAVAGREQDRKEGPSNG